MSRYNGYLHVSKYIRLYSVIFVNLVSLQGHHSFVKESREEREREGGEEGRERQRERDFDEPFFLDT